MTRDDGRRPALAAVVMLAAGLLLAGCGFGSHGDDRPAATTTTATGTPVAPAGAPYRFTAPAGFSPSTLPAEEMKAGSHVDLASVFDAPTVDGLTTLSVLAFDAGEPVTDDPITLGSLPAFAITYDGATGEAPIRTLYRGAAVGSWVVVAQCSGAGPAAIAGL